MTEAINFIYFSITFVIVAWGLWHVAEVAVVMYEHRKLMRRMDKYNRWLSKFHRPGHWEALPIEEKNVYRFHMLEVMRGKNKEMRGPWEDLL